MAEFIVGKFYSVPCVRLLTQHGHIAQNSGGWVPTIGPEHHDRETIGFMPMHFHVDVRFLSSAALARLGFGDDAFRSPIQRALTMPVSTWSDGVGDLPAPHEKAMRRMKCRRAMPDFPSAKHSPTWRQFEADYAGCKLKPGNICPHRGIDLTPFIKEDGTVICPGHGLRWDTKTGDLLPHHRAPA